MGVVEGTRGAHANNPNPRKLGEDINSGDSKIEFLGNSPNYRYYPDADENDFIMVKFQRLQEVDQDGSNVPGPDRRITGIASEDFSFEKETVDEDGVDIIRVTLSLQQGNRSINITNYIPEVCQHCQDTPIFIFIFSVYG